MTPGRHRIMDDSLPLEECFGPQKDLRLARVTLCVLEVMLVSSELTSMSLGSLGHDFQARGRPQSPLSTTQ